MIQDHCKGIAKPNPVVLAWAAFPLISVVRAACQAQGPGLAFGRKETFGSKLQTHI